MATITCEGKDGLLVYRSRSDINLNGFTSQIELIDRVHVNELWEELFSGGIALDRAVQITGRLCRVHAITLEDIDSVERMYCGGQYDKE